MDTKANTIDQEIERHVEYLRMLPLNSDEYEETLKRLTELHRIKARSRKFNVSQDVIFGAVANILGIIVIMNYERLHVISTKAFNWPKRL